MKDNCCGCREEFTCLHNKGLYFLALCKDYKRPDTVVLQARHCLDDLSCETWVYLGARVTTKKQLAECPDDTLYWVNKAFGSNYTRLRVD